MSTETIYQSLYVQSRGALRRDLVKCLRTGRALRQPNRQGAQRKNRVLPDMVNVSQRPAEAKDRAVPGHCTRRVYSASLAAFVDEFGLAAANAGIWRVPRHRTRAGHGVCPPIGTAANGLFAARVGVAVPASLPPTDSLAGRGVVVDETTDRRRALAAGRLPSRSRPQDLASFFRLDGEDGRWVIEDRRGPSNQLGLALQLCAGERPRPVGGLAAALGQHRGNGLEPSLGAPQPTAERSVASSRFHVAGAPAVQLCTLPWLGFPIRRADRRPRRGGRPPRRPAGHGPGRPGAGTAAGKNRTTPSTYARSWLGWAGRRPGPVR